MSSSLPRGPSTNRAIQRYSCHQFKARQKETAADVHDSAEATGEELKTLSSHQQENHTVYNTKW